MSKNQKQEIKNVLYIFYRNTFYLTNGILFLVVLFLYFFGDSQSAFFLGLVLFLNTSFGLVQDLRSWQRLRELQILTAPRITLVDKNGKEKIILVDDIKTGDHLKLKTGDQVPCDGELLDTFNIELNEGLITGESQTFMRKTGEQVLAGSIITAGQGIMVCKSVFEESRISRMTEGLKKYEIKFSPIQESVTIIVRISSYVLFAVIIFILLKGYYLHIPNLLVIKNIGAMASILVPQGFIFSMAVFYAYGAIHLLNKNILLQEVNATEKLGLIKNLCIDKTGTLTENTFEVETMYVRDHFTSEQAKELTASYFFGSKDESQIAEVIKNFVGQNYSGKITNAMPFSATRSYGAVSLDVSGVQENIYAGPCEFFLPYVKESQEVEWINKILAEDSRHGKRLLCVVQSKDNLGLENFANKTFKVVAVFVLSSKLREGIKSTINFFQKRGVRIRIISGDNAQTVQSVAEMCGIKQTEKIVTGEEMKKWSAADFLQKSADYTIFARTIPEQKEQIIFALKQNAFTAMIGDGANDALAIKKADLGIAMFDGSPATRQLASVILTNNSFTALPDGVVLADSIIKNTVIFAALFLDFAFAGFLFWATLLGKSFPLAPLNITLINYFSVGIPWFLVSYWTILPGNSGNTKVESKFLHKVLPFVISSSILQAIVFALILFLESSFIVLGFILIGLAFFLVTPKVYLGKLSGKQIKEMIYLGIFEILLLIVGVQIPFALKFFDTTLPTFTSASTILFATILAFYAIVQIILAWWFRIKN